MRQLANTFLKLLMDKPHQGNKPPKPARVGGPHSGRRRPDFDDTEEQMREHRRQPSLEEAARRVERQLGVPVRIDRNTNPPHIEVQGREGRPHAVLERRRSDAHGRDERVLWYISAEGERLLEAEPDFEKALAVLLDIFD